MVMPMLEVKQISTGLWRWQVPHAEWKPEKGGPGGWEQIVGCVYYEPPPESAAVSVAAAPIQSARSCNSGISSGEVKMCISESSSQ